MDLFAVAMSVCGVANIYNCDNSKSIICTRKFSAYKKVSNILECINFILKY